MKYEVLHTIDEDNKVSEIISVRSDARREVLVQRAVNAIATKMMKLYGDEIHFRFHQYGILYNCESFLWATDKDGKEHYVSVIRCKDDVIIIG